MADGMENAAALWMDVSAHKPFPHSHLWANTHSQPQQCHLNGSIQKILKSLQPAQETWEDSKSNLNHALTLQVACRAWGWGSQPPWIQMIRLVQKLTSGRITRGFVCFPNNQTFWLYLTLHCNEHCSLWRPTSGAVDLCACSIRSVSPTRCCKKCTRVIKKMTSVLNE